jgi:hypothetical protein
MLPTGGPVTTLSPFKTVSIWRFVFQKIGHFGQILEAVTPFDEFSPKNNNHSFGSAKNVLSASFHLNQTENQFETWGIYYTCPTLIHGWL